MPVRGESGEELLTTAEAAAALDLTTSTIRVLVTKGKLRKVLLGPRAMLIPREDVERYRRESLGRPGRKSDTPTKTAKYSRAYRARKKAQPQGQQGEPPAED